MGEPIKISETIEKISKEWLMPPIRRFAYLPYSLKSALQAVIEIGRLRNPKFVIDDDNVFTYVNMIRWVHGDEEMQCLNPTTKEIIRGRLNAGIYIAGNTGTGKSWVLEIISEYSKIDNVKLAMLDTIRPLRWNNYRTDSICDEYTESGLITKYKEMGIVGFQDLGSEQQEALYMGNRVNVMRKILEHRGDFPNKITLITSNLPITHPKLTEAYGERVSSRLIEMCNYFEIKGTDRRKLK